MESRDLTKRLITLLTLGLACWLALSGTALAKGPAGLTIDAPGPGEPIEIRGVSESCRSGICPELLEAVGFFQLMFDVEGEENQRAPAIDRTPEGPVYVLTWDMGVDIPMDVYPVADGGPLVHLAPGLYEEGAHSQSFEVPGGWFRADEALLDLLVTYGVHLDGTAIPERPRDNPDLHLPSVILVGLALIAFLPIHAAGWIQGFRLRHAPSPAGAKPPQAGAEPPDRDLSNRL